MTKRELITIGMALFILTIMATVVLIYKTSQDEVEKIEHVNWVKINPPPDESGPCYVYFEGNPLSYRGYSGVWCK